MITFLIGFGSVVAVMGLYATIGIWYARSLAVQVYARRLAEHRRRWPSLPVNQYVPQEAREELFWKAALWPVVMPIAGFRRLVGPDVLLGPVHERRERAERLRADAEFWADEAKRETDEEKQRMAKEIARLLREQAKETELS